MDQSNDGSTLALVRPIIRKDHAPRQWIIAGYITETAQLQGYAVEAGRNRIESLYRRVTGEKNGQWFRHRILRLLTRDGPGRDGLLL